MANVLPICRNPSLGLATKARWLQGYRPKRKLGVMPHAPRSARECEGIDLHTPKGTPTLGVEVPMDFQIFIMQLQGSKPIALRSSLYH